jgi:fructose-1,6-bisphosphatase I
MTSGMTLSDFVVGAEGFDRELIQLLLEIASCCRDISVAVSTAKIRGIVGLTGESNVHGERQVALDVEANNLLMKRLALSHTLGLFLSEEVGDVLETKHHGAGKYVFACDPFDGSSLARSSGTVRTIWGIHRVQGETPSQSDFLQSGRSLVAAGMAVYGSDRQFLFTTGNGVHQFVFDPYRMDWVLVNENLIMPEPSVVTYAVNEANHMKWTPDFRKFINRTIKQSIYPASLRYCGSLVGDGLRVLCEGANYFYPEDESYPNGKLRYVYECAPMSTCRPRGWHAITTKTCVHVCVDSSSLTERGLVDVDNPSELFFSGFDAMEDGLSGRMGVEGACVAVLMEGSR